MCGDIPRGRHSDGDRMMLSSRWQWWRRQQQLRESHVMLIEQLDAVKCQLQQQPLTYSLDRRGRDGIIVGLVIYRLRKRLDGPQLLTPTVSTSTSPAWLRQSRRTSRPPSTSRQPLFSDLCPAATAIRHCDVPNTAPASWWSDATPGSESIAYHAVAGSRWLSGAYLFVVNLFAVCRCCKTHHHSLWNSQAV